MRFLKFDSFTFKSQLSSDEVFNRLTENIEPNNYFNFFSIVTIETEKPFEGKIEKGHFQIKKNIKYRNSFNPILSGWFKEIDSGTIINLNLRVNWIVKIVSFLMLVVFVLMFLSIQGDYKIIPIVFIPILHFLIHIGYSRELKRAKAVMTKILE